MTATLAALAVAAVLPADWCEVEVPEVDSRSSRANYSVVLDPTGGEDVLIDVLFYYLEDHEGDLNGRTARAETARWIELANLYLSRGTSGLQLRSAAVLPMPSDVRAEFRLSQGGFAPLLAVAADSPVVASDRLLYGGDLATFIAYDKKRWSVDGTATIWLNDMHATEHRRLAMNGVVWGSESPEVLFLHEVGHNLGLDHHFENLREGRLDQLFDRKGIGYLQEDGAGSDWGTVMSGGVRAELGGFSNGGRIDLPLAEGSRHRREPHWPNLLPAGDHTADADQALRKTIGHVAAFYEPRGDDGDDPDPDPPPPGPDGPCKRSAETLCLHGERFEARVDWWTADGETGPALVVPKATQDSGLFRFFDADNWEILIKVLNGCEVNGHYWVYGASTTDLGYVIRVADTTTGDVREYRNEPGQPAAAISDSRAFPDSCRP